MKEDKYMHKMNFTIHDMLIKINIRKEKHLKTFNMCLKSSNHSDV